MSESINFDEWKAAVEAAQIHNVEARPGCYSARELAEKFGLTYAHFRHVTVHKLLASGFLKKAGKRTALRVDGQLTLVPVYELVQPQVQPTTKEKRKRRMVPVGAGRG